MLDAVDEKVVDLFGHEPDEDEDRTWRPLGSSGFVRAAKVPPIIVPPPKNGPRKYRVVDSFAGFGGASEAIKQALERLAAAGLLPEGHSRDVDWAVNHDEPALVMHAANHPNTIHLPHNVWKVSMRELLGDDFFGLLWLSPDCRDHSPAKGKPITSRSVRDLAWVLIRWLKELPDWQRPYTIFLENVPAFTKWSPLIPTGNGEYVRDKSREGQIFHRFVMAVAKFGYSIGWQELEACDYGTPTIRKRLKMVFRRDGARIAWPKPTHGAPASDDVKSGRLKPWPVAADIVDFDLPCPSILMTKEEAKAYTKETGIRIIRPLATNSEARIAKGVRRYVVDEAEPFIATLNHDGEGFRGQGLGEPFKTVARARDAHGLVVPHMMTMRNAQKPHSSMREPTHTVTAGGAGLTLVEAEIAPHIISFRADQVGRSVKSPLSAVTANSFVKRPGGASPIGMASTMLVPFCSYGQHGGRSRSILDPHHTVKASAKDQNQIVAATIAPFIAQNNGDRKLSGVEYPRAGRPIGLPLGAATTQSAQSLAAVYLTQNNGGPRAPIGRSVREPYPTALRAGSQQSLVSATFLKREFGASVGSSMRAPIGAVTAGGGGKTQLMAAHMLSLKGSARRAGSCEDPHVAVCAAGQHSAVVTLPLMTAYYSTGGQHAAMSDPMLAVPTKARFGLTEATGALPPISEEMLDRARRVADFLRKYGCWDEREFVVVTIRGIEYIIVDIGMRMLTPRELARAQGFPDSYKLAVPYVGGVISETKQRHGIGNSVCWQPAAAVIFENHRPPLDAHEAPLFVEAAE
ncbi:MAG: hypothetical protein E6Q76_13140 [Rhizobium sp.]|nr:MAG: hypothetical protein E6Q76_13140 [Rhizobium sp.]